MSATLVNAVRMHLEPGGTYLAGFSGGADSLALLDVLDGLRGDTGINLIAVHVDHGLRGGESDADAAFCESFCRARGITCRVVRVDAAEFARTHKLSLEDAARRCRFRAFASVGGGEHAAALFLAHHADDQAETLLLRLFRGAGLRGIAGMKPVTAFHGLTIIRPWLSIRRAEIGEYIRERGLPFREDSTNDDRRFARNWLRHELLPRINEQFGPDVTERLCRLGDVARGAEAFIEKAGRRFLDVHAMEGILGTAVPLSEFEALDLAVQRAALDLIARGVDEDIRLEYTTVEAVRAAFIERRAPAVTLPGGLVCGVAWGHGFAGRPPAQVGRVGVNIGGVVSLPNGCEVRIERANGRGEPSGADGELWRAAALGQSVAMVQYAEVAAGAACAVRARREGERYHPVNGREKKVKDLLIAAGIPQVLKESIPVIEVNGETAWLAGWRVADAFRVQGRGTIVKLVLSYKSLASKSLAIRRASDLG
ncbi:tRNA lysidine(34) synthetase TilS [bacterium]|nr:tRNA lysidine(34) synthetase TilS [bacterium]